MEHEVQVLRWVSECAPLWVSCQRPGQGTRKSHLEQTAIARQHGPQRVVRFLRHEANGPVYANLSCGCSVMLSWMPSWELAACDNMLDTLKRVWNWTPLA